MIRFLRRTKWLLCTVCIDDPSCILWTICSFVAGRRVDVEQAIELIAKRFPSARYPQVAFKPINKKIILRQRPPERVPIPQAVAQVERRAEECWLLSFLGIFSFSCPMAHPRKSWSLVWSLAIISSFNKLYTHPMPNLPDWIIPCPSSIIIQKRRLRYLDQFKVNQFSRSRSTIETTSPFSGCHLCCAHASRLVSSAGYSVQQ